MIMLTQRRSRGLGQPPGYLENCSQSSVGGQYACALRNMEKQDLYYSGADGEYARQHGGVPPQTIVDNIITLPAPAPRTPLFPAPSPVVNPSPPGQPTGPPGTTVTEIANGAKTPTEDLTSTVGGYIANITNTTGIPSWGLLAAGAAALFFMAKAK
jgi:hypothetical protein